jgi:putative endonuclease
MYYLYILRMNDGRLYTGVTNDLCRRELEHGIKPSTRTTKIFGSDQLLYTEEHPNQSSALKRERQIKKWSQAKKLALANRDLSKLKALSKCRRA